MKALNALILLLCLIDRVLRIIIFIPFVALGFFWGLIVTGIKAGMEFEENSDEYIHDKINEIKTK